MRLHSLIENATIVMMDESHPRASRMGIWNGQVVGFDDDLDGLSAATINAAWATRREHALGSLTPGNAADFVVLDRSPFDVDAAQIGEIGVERTYIDGVLRWDR